MTTKRLKLIISLVLIGTVIFSLNIVSRMLREQIILHSSIEVANMISNVILAVTFVLTVVIAALTIAGIVQKTKEKITTAVEQFQEKDRYEQAQQNPFDKVSLKIDRYLAENESTEFFRKTLTTMSKQLPGIKRQHSNAMTLIDNKFDGISLNKYANKVNGLVESLLELAYKFVKKLEMFDEGAYTAKVSNQGGEYGEDVGKFEKVLNRYVQNAKDVLRFFNDTMLALDNAILELQEMDSKELDSMMDKLSNINEAIDELKLY